MNGKTIVILFITNESNKGFVQAQIHEIQKSFSNQKSTITAELVLIPDSQSMHDSLEKCRESIEKVAPTEIVVMNPNHLEMLRNLAANIAVEHLDSEFVYARSLAPKYVPDFSKENNSQLRLIKNVHLSDSSDKKKLVQDIRKYTKHKNQ